MNSETEQQPVDKPASEYTRDSVIKTIFKNTDPNMEEHLKIVLKCPAHLCIFESKKSIDAYVTIDNYQSVLKILYNRLFQPQNDKTPSTTSVEGIDQMPIEKCLDSISITETQKLKEDWLDSIIGSSESKIENQGNKLWNKLIPPNIKETLESELQSDNDKIKDVWIFSEEENIDYPWEGIYWKDFYWGDRFNIVRIPENCDFEIERAKSPIKRVAILLDERCDCALSNMKSLFNICELYSTKSSHYNIRSLHNAHIEPIDYMHIAADIKIIKKNRRNFIDVVREALLSENPMFIFYNMWNDKEKHSMHKDILEVVDSIPAKTRIYTSFDVPKDFAVLFAKCFYDCVVKENDVAKAVKKAREEINNGYLFSITDVELERDLKDHKIREGSNGIFEDEDIELSDDVIVENIAEENDIWMVRDRKNEKTYHVKKKDGMLTIYETASNLSFKRFCRFAYVVVNGNPFTAATWARS